MTGNQDQPRQFAKAMVLLAIASIVAGLALIAYYQHQIESYRSAHLPPTSQEAIRTARAMKHLLLGLLLLAGVFIISSYAFVRWSRRFRNQLLRKPHPPTPSDDVWAMHRLPDDDNRGTNSDRTTPP